MIVSYLLENQILDGNMEFNLNESSIIQVATKNGNFEMV